MRRLFWVFPILFALCFSTCSALAATLTWDGDGSVPLGGSGTWNTSALNWWMGSGYQAWDNSTANDAVFDTTGGNVTLTTTVNVGNISFNATGYTLSGNYGPKLVGTAPTISVAADIQATISTFISGTSGLNKTGAGLLALERNNPYTGITTVSDGVLRMQTLNSTNINIAGGVLELKNVSSFTGTLGTGLSQIQFTGSGGFSTYNTDNLVISLNGGASLTWGSGGFVPDGSELILNSTWSNGSVFFQNAINLGNSVRTVRVNMGSITSGAGLSGVLTGAGGLNKTGSGTLLLTKINTYTGPTIVAEGILQLRDSNALPGGLNSTGGTSNLNIAGGIVEILPSVLSSPGFPPVTVMSRSVGTEPSQVQFTGSGGFMVTDKQALSSFVTNYAVNLGADSHLLTWGNGGFVPDGATLILSTNATSVALDFQNPVDLGASLRTIHVPQGAAILSRSLTGSGGLIKTGAGILELGAVNGYSGPTILNEGTLRLSNAGALPAGSGNLTIASGVVELNDIDFNHALGTGPGEVQLIGSGGFAGTTVTVPGVYPPPGQSRKVNLGGQSAQVKWGSGGFVPDGATFILGSATANSSVDFQNPIELGNGLRTIRVDGLTNIAFRYSAILSGSLSGSGGLIKTGEGNLDLTAANTYTGETQVRGGILRLFSPQALPGGTGATGGTSHLSIADGGCIGLNSGDFQRNLGSGPGDVQFSGSGGFIGCSNRIVNFGGASAPVSWDNNPYLSNDCTLILGNLNSSGPLELQNPLVLGAGKRIISTSFASGDTHARLSGIISGIGGLKKTGGSVLELTAANTYTGETEVNSGDLRLCNPEAVPGGIGTSGGTSNLNISGGVVVLADGNFTRALGAAPSQVQFTSSGGFSAYGTDRVVNIGGAAAGVVWGTNSFVPSNSRLLLSSNYSNSTVDFQNPIDLGSSTRTIDVANGAAAVDAKLSGTLSGSGGLNKTRDGTLELTAANTYTGQTKISGGLRLSHAQALPGGIGSIGGTSNLVFSFASSVVELAAGDFTRSLGSGPSQAQFASYSGGFAAVNANRIVNFGGDSSSLTWGQKYFDMNNLILGSPNANATLDFQNPINLGTSTRTIQVDRGSDALDAKLTGILSGTGGLTKTGKGILQLSALNTYSGNTSITVGTLLVDGSLTSSSSIVISSQATLGGIGSVGKVIVSNGGHISPGDTIGTLTLVGDLNLYSGAKLDFDLVAETNSDKLAMPSSALILNGQQFADFTFNTLSGFGQGSYVLIDAGTIQGSLGTICTGNIAGLPATLSVSDNDLVLTVVPEPSTFMLLAMGAIGLLAFARRRKR